MGIIVARWIIITLFTIISGDFMLLVVDTIAIFVLTILLWLGTRVNMDLEST